MLQSIDTLIAFVVIMTVASLFVTILVQMFSAALSLRGKNLANALALTFQTIEPSLAEKAHELAANILSDPLLSDSTRTEKDKGIEDSAADRKSPWHFTDVFGATRLASAVRPEEVYAELKRIATGGGSLSEAAKKVLDALIVPRDEAAKIKAQLGVFLEIAGQISEGPVREKLLALVEDTPAHLIVQADAARAKFDAWFGSAQNRAQQWFQLHTRGLAIAASALVALLLQLDAVEVFRDVSTNVAGRAALVSSAGKVINEADGALDERGGLIARIADAWAEQFQRPRIALAGIVHLGRLQEALVRQGPTFDAKEFERLVATTTNDYYKDEREKLRELTRGVSATGFAFIPVHYWRWSSPMGWRGSVANIRSHLPGIALFAALLTLGAPYWYNLLKNITSLRPALAQVISKEEAARVPATK